MPASSPCAAAPCKKEPVYIALGTDHEGRREILGFFLVGAEGESAHAWREIFSGLKERGVERIDIVVTGDLAGIEEAARAVFPGAGRKLCFLHAMRNSQRKVRRKDWEEVSQDLKAIYRARSQGEAGLSLFSLAERWKRRYPSLVRYWRENFPHLVAFMKYPEEVRLYIYTTNQLEREGKEVKRRTKTIEVFSSEESLISVLYLILKNENERLGQRRLRGFAKLMLEEEG